jgi:methylmalonyl-CoA/ethylmalonyl-CoA epimerase
MEQFSDLIKNRRSMRKFTDQELTQEEVVALLKAALMAPSSKRSNCWQFIVVEDQKVKTAFLKVGDVKIELLEPTSPESTIAKFIEKNNGNGGMHHLAFAVEDGVANALAEAETTGIRLIDKAPRKGAEGLQIAFLHPKSTLGVLTELCEKP